MTSSTAVAEQAGSVPRLRVTELSVERRGRTVLDQVAFSVMAGELVAVRGDNGAGKTTLLRTLAGITQPLDGRIELDGEKTRASGELLRRNVALISHAGGLIADVPVMTTYQQWRALHVCRSENEMDHWIDALGIRELVERRPVDMSQGQQRRCALMQMAIRDARVWLLDEPMAALDADSRSIVDTLVQARLSGGASVVVSTHDDWPPKNSSYGVTELNLQSVAERERYD